ncbi:MAG: hypothetical protein IPO40_17870 [Fibrobacteres bacterium]|nr:hypothetical protein [Fibrobacterota bacterium]
MKYEKHSDYPDQANDRVLSVLLALWPSMPESVKDDLVLVGGLAVHLLTRHERNPFGPSSVTLDVDLGIALGASTGTYDTVTRSLQGIGFRTVDRRLVRSIDGLEIAVDFLVEGHSGAGRMVDDVHASAFPGIQRALESKEQHLIQGRDAYGVEKSMEIPVVGLGPLLVLKLNAFSNRRQPKDAFDFLTLAMIHHKSAGQALAGERRSNPGFSVASRCLEEFFLDSEKDGPRRALAFRGGAQGSLLDEDRVTLEVMATAGQFLFEELAKSDSD